MLKHIIVCMALFHTLNAEQEESPECLENSVNLDSEFLLCCRGKPTFTSDNCVEEMVKSNYTLPPECMVDCMYKDFKIYNGSHIDMIGVKTYFEENVHEQDVRDLFINGFEACNSKTDLSKQPLFSADAEANDSLDCDLFPFYMDQCLWYHTLSHCPERLAGGKKEECQIKSNWVKQCLFD